MKKLVVMNRLGDLEIWTWRGKKVTAIIPEVITILPADYYGPYSGLKKKITFRKLKLSLTYIKDCAEKFDYDACNRELLGPL